MGWKPDETLWRVIQRYDFYFGTTNTKAAFLIAFHTFVLGLVAVQLGNIDAIAPAGHVRIAFAVLAGVTAVGTLVPLALVIAVISPYLRSNKKLGTYHSIIFFGDVAEHPTPEDFAGQLKTYTDEKLDEDLLRQVHVLAKGLARKFELLRRSVLWTLFLQLPALAIFVGLIVYQRL